MSVLKKITQIAKSISNLARTYDTNMAHVRMSQGKILAELNRTKTSTDLKDYEFSIYSQFGEDGIIERLVSILPIPNKTFIEFGVEDFSEANCRFLLQNRNWRGMVIDGSESNISRIRNAPYYWMHDLKALHSFITRENINDLLNQSGFDSDLGILSVDIDGVDYWVLQAITSHQPRILIVEYNGGFGADRCISVPYKADFQRTVAHHSNLYFGASLSAFHHLADTMGYALVGTNSAGCNAFFVRRDLVGATLQVLSPEQAFTPSQFRQERDKDGNLTGASTEDGFARISGMPVINVQTGATEPL